MNDYVVERMSHDRHADYQREVDRDALAALAASNPRSEKARSSRTLAGQARSLLSELLHGRERRRAGGRCRRVAIGDMGRRAEFESSATTTEKATTATEAMGLDSASCSDSARARRTLTQTAQEQFSRGRRPLRGISD
jgi:hypothetical protein